jgi:Ca2+-binding RTX toxin-like protein
VLGGYGGNDTVTGGAGSDTFYLTRGYDQDTITDFSVGEDLITIYGLDTDFDTFQEIMDAATSYGPGGEHTQIDFGEGDVLLLRNVTLASLTSDSFEIIV